MECAHPPCTCLVEQPGGCCSEACAELVDLAEGCGCNHRSCEETPTSPATDGPAIPA